MEMVALFEVHVFLERKEVAWRLVLTDTMYVIFNWNFGNNSLQRGHGQAGFLPNRMANRMEWLVTPRSEQARLHHSVEIPQGSGRSLTVHAVSPVWRTYRMKCWSHLRTSATTRSLPRRNDARYSSRKLRCHLMRRTHFLLITRNLCSSAVSHGSSGPRSNRRLCWIHTAEEAVNDHTMQPDDAIRMGSNTMLVMKCWLINV